MHTCALASVIRFPTPAPAPHLCPLACTTHLYQMVCSAFSGISRALSTSPSEIKNEGHVSEGGKRRRKGGI